jgi:hypothetical protein
MSTTHHTTETATVIAAKVAPPATVSLATVMGYQLNEIVLWATLIYTSLLICQKSWQIYKEFTEK